jgi:glycosyltransferase involved in cell wall biosynthesis
MDVIYSNGARFAGGGIGNTSYHAVRGLYGHGLLKRLICGSFRRTEIPETSIKSLGWFSRIFRKIASYDSQNRLDYVYRLLYDRWASHQLQPCTLFHGWSGYNLYAFRQAKKMGMMTVLDRALAHPVYLDKLLQEEYSRWGLAYRPSNTAQYVQQEIETADYVLVPSEFVYRTFEAENEDIRKLVTIPFGVDIKRFCPLPESDSVPKKFQAIFLGQINIRKGAHYLLEAWRMLKWKNAELLLVGTNKLPSLIKAKYRDLSGVRYLGYLPDPIRTLQKATVFVFPSLAEGSALVTYEAMACGLPLITTFHAGSLVQNEEQGFIVPPQQATAIAMALEKLRTDESLQRQMGRSARHKVESFTWESYGDKMASILQKIVN